MYYIKGKSRYSNPTHPIKKGMSKGKYQVGIQEFEATKELEKIIKPFIKTDKEKGVTFIQVSNSKYPIMVFDKDNNYIDDKNIRIKNGTNIEIAFEINHKDNYDTDYIAVKGIKILDEYKPYNPFDM